MQKIANLSKPGVYILPFTTIVSRGKEKTEKAKTGKGKNWKLTHFWREIAFLFYFHILTYLFTLFFGYFFLSLFIFFFFSLFLCCPRDFWHGLYFVGILSVFFTLFLYFFLSLLVFFFPLFVLPEGFSPFF